MTQVDFYVLESTDQQAQHHFACRLTEKAVTQGNKVMLATDNAEQSQLFDEMLWSFSPESFVPHFLVSEQGVNHTPVGIGHNYSTDHIATHHDVLINIRKGLPSQFGSFKRLAEIVVQDEEILRATRKNYAFYKERGYPIRTHKIKS